MKSGSESRGRRWTPPAIAAVVGIVMLLIIGLVYDVFLRDRVIELSEEKLSELLNMNVKFDHYEFIDGASLEVSGLHIESPYAREDYQQVNDYHTDWISARIGRIRLSDFSYERLIKNSECSASKVIIDSVTVQVYRDKTIPNPPFVHKELPASLLRAIGGSVSVDTILISHVNIVYEERTHHSEKPGKISFNNLSAECYHLTNDAERLALNPYFVITGRANVQDKAQLTANIRFDLSSENDAFTMTASAQPFDAQILNPVITGVLPARITGGAVKALQIEVDANDDRATGTLVFEYSGMQFELLDTDGESKSWLVNLAGKAMTRNENLRSENNFREGVVDFSRRKDRFIFNYWWNSLKSGIVDVMVSDAGKLLKLDEKAAATD